MEDRVFMLVPRWEYRQESGLTIEELNEIGQEGWELAGYAAAGNSPIRTFYVFKRPIYDAPEGKQVEEPDGQLSYLNNTPISHLIAEVDRLDMEDFAKSFPGNRAKKRGYGKKLEYICHYNDIKTVGDLLSYGRSEYLRINGNGKLSAGYVGKALENLYGVKTW